MLLCIECLMALRLLTTIFSHAQGDIHSTQEVDQYRTAALTKLTRIYLSTRVFEDLVMLY